MNKYLYKLTKKLIYQQIYIHVLAIYVFDSHSKNGCRFMMDPRTDDFNIYLTSFSDYDYYPANNQFDYHVRLPHIVRLANGEWECGLSSVTFCKDWINVQDGENVFQVSFNALSDDQPIVWLPHTIPAKQYDSITSLLSVLNEKVFTEPIRSLEPRTPTETLFVRDDIEFEGQLECTVAPDRRVNVKIVGDLEGVRFQDGLAETLGFPKGDAIYLSATPSISKDIPQLDWQRQMITIKCDLLSPQLHCDTYIRSLRTVYAGALWHGGVLSKDFDPYYMTVDSASFDTVHVQMTDVMNEEILSVGRGRSHAVLNFRRL